ncbi:MAG: glycosyltransferase family 39 protein [Candidatus Shapirobacteria bacterium]|jgi:hypothetical protein
METRRLYLIFIIVLASFLRFGKLTSLPPSLFSDEVDAGYQALTFTQKQTDYFGNKFPTHFHSFSDWRTSLQIYSISIFQNITKNHEISVRLPSAFFGIFSVFVLYLITKSLIPTLLLAISPWAIHYSRTGFEVSGMVLVILLGIYFWQQFLKTNKYVFIFLSAFSFCLSPYYYSTAKLFLPILAILIFLIWKKEIMRIGVKKLFPVVCFCLLILSPLISDTVSGRSGFRFSYISIFTQPHREQVVDSLRYQDILMDHPNQIGVKTPLLSYVFHNKLQIPAKRFMENYISSFSTEFLIIRGDANSRHGFGGHGLIYLIDYFLILIGIFATFIPKNKLSLLFLGLLLTSPIPYALTRDSNSPHATRLILMLPSIIYFTYLGINHLRSQNRHVFYLLLTLYLLSLINFGHYYYYHYPQDSARYWHTGMKEAILASNFYWDNPIVFSDSYEPFLPFFLFYKPHELDSTSLTTNLVEINNPSFSGQSLDNTYYFGHINWSNLSQFPSNSVFVVPKSEYDGQNIQNTVIKQVINKRYLNQEEFYLITFNQ